MINVCMKFEKAGPNQTLVIDQTRLYMTDGPKGVKQYNPSSPKVTGDIACLAQFLLFSQCFHEHLFYGSFFR